MNSIFEDLSKRELILTRVDFDKNQKLRWRFADWNSGEILSFSPEFEKPITLKINLSNRFCTGWHSLKTGEDFTCPEKSTLDKKYNQCQKCQKITGFNPAFYNASASEISSQQQARNSQPHFVYLAYFSDDVIKVGISFSGRGIARLLEQGARAALILDEFSSANIARNYEEKISKMPDLCENVKTGIKLKLLENKFDFSKAQKTLLNARQKIEERERINFEKNKPIDLNEFYFKNSDFTSKEIIHSENYAQNNGELIFSGILKAQIGYILLAEQQDEIVSIALRKFTGYKIQISPKITEIELPERQASLFDF